MKEINCGLCLAFGINFIVRANRYDYLSINYFVDNLFAVIFLIFFIKTLKSIIKK